MKIYDQLEEMKGFIAEGDWDGLEKSARKRCEKLAGKEITAQIGGVDLADFAEELEEGLKRAYEEAEDAEAQAVYYEYDMENQWVSAYFICPEYLPEEEEDDDWASVSDEELEGPACPEFGELFAGSFDASDKDRGINGYLIARTVSAFGRCVDLLPDPECAVCMGFHDQDSVMRIREGEERDTDLDDEDEADEE